MWEMTSSRAGQCLLNFASERSKWNSNKWSQKNWSDFGLSQVLFSPVDTLWASLSAFLLLFLLSSFSTSDFLSCSPPCPPPHFLLCAHPPKYLSKMWSWSYHFSFEIIQGLPIAYRIMPKFPGMTFMGCHDLESLNFFFPDPLCTL